MTELLWIFTWLPLALTGEFKVYQPETPKHLDHYDSLSFLCFIYIYDGVRSGLWTHELQHMLKSQRRHEQILAVAAGLALPVAGATA